MPNCTLCIREKTDKNHISHVRMHMITVYGNDACLRKGCEELVGAASGYCTGHHAEWVHTENAHNLALLTQREAAGTCAKCSAPKAHPKSAYCVQHRREYNQALRARQKSEVPS